MGNREVLDIRFNRIFTNFSWLVFGIMVNRFFLFMTNVLLATRLDKKTFGLISLAYSLMVIFIGVGDFGLNLLATKEIARNRAQAKILGGQFLILKVVLALVSFLILFLFSFLKLSVSIRYLTILFGLGIFFNPLTFSWFYRALEKMFIVGGCLALSGCSYFLLTLFFVNSPRDSYKIPLFYVLPWVVCFILFLQDYGGGWSSFKVNHRLWKRWIKETVPLGLGLVGWRLYMSLGILLLGFFLSTKEIGLFKASHMLVAFIYIVIGKNLASSGYPFLSQLYVEKHSRERLKDYLNIMIRKLFVVMAPITFFLFIFSSEIMRGLFRGKYDEAINVFRILILTLPFATIGTFIRNLLPSFDRYNIFLYSILSMIIVSFLGGTLLIPVYSINGMAIALLFGELYGFFLLFLYVKYKITPIYLGWKINRYIMLNIVIFILGFWIKNSRFFTTKLLLFALVLSWELIYLYLFKPLKMQGDIYA